ncbi:MAG: biopolymer transporter ExbD [Verrucomicrobia bacterium]|nr:MAG: biopolymer transporter ExbD [Verrucomicrobiota bacterium]
MARKRKKSELHAGELNLTAMIDIAFQMLNFFVITAKPMDVLTNLDVFRPSPDAPPPKEAKPPAVIRIGVINGGLLLNDRQASIPMLRDFLEQMAKLDKAQTVLIQCATDSRHGQLVEVLDLCNRLGLTNLSVVSAS